MGSSCCGNEVKFDGASREYKKRLWAVIFLNALMFVVEITAGCKAGATIKECHVIKSLSGSRIKRSKVGKIV